MAISAKYITCGLYDQYLSLIQGNSMGLTSDLQQALSDFEAGTLDVIVDAIFGGTQVAEFLDRTYKSEERLGKVVYKYD